jgi:hypothetical protein
MPKIATTPRISKAKPAAKRRHLPAGVTGATLLARVKRGDFGHGIDWAAVTLAYGSRRRRSRAA